ncbi:protein Atg16l2-like isoform X3 [Dunckerocampus dactyliophorus]|uniref:protein Atg16l2-like isoform X3 n=1 Tax=Dunckerocampus dactyliophorus TaxID=161453 RepID=UPI00240643E6|nr:protein Atg16l2-like isoform X3 [Dunckerocampus dactyliophorus]XP_054651250.1 protein Atg16l2-like isoform X3 [Dunckerocampus dactyliophorus]
MADTKMWKGHIVHQLKHRDQQQHHMFRELIGFYSRLLEKTSLTNLFLSCSARVPDSDGRHSLSCLLLEKKELKKTTGELAYQVVKLQQQMKIKEKLLEDQCDRLLQEECWLAGALDVRQQLRVRVERVQEENRLLKKKYDGLMEHQRWAESHLREEKVRGSRLLEDMIHPKQQAAARMNHRNERRSSSFSLSNLRCSSLQETLPEKSQGRLLRSASASSPSTLSTIRELFEKKRGQSICGLEEDLLCPVGVSMLARVPVRALQVLDAHEQGINATSFCSSSALLASGGTDRVVKLWHVRAGALRHSATLDGSTEGITCVEFDPTGHRILAGSYDKSALLWRLDDPVPKLTLTGHNRKVTAARFSLQQVVTGSADRTIRLWDLQRAASTWSARKTSPSVDILTTRYDSGTPGWPAVFMSWKLRAKSRHWTSAPTAASCSAAVATTASNCSTSAGGAARAPPSEPRASNVEVTAPKWPSAQMLALWRRDQQMAPSTFGTSPVATWRHV